MQREIIREIKKLGDEGAPAEIQEIRKMHDQIIDANKGNIVFEQFNSLLARMFNIFKKKNHDYAGNDAFSNFKQSEKIGISAWKGCLIRLGDKFSRLCQLSRKGTMEVKDETFEDTCMDLAVYALILILLRRDGK